METKHTQDKWGVNSAIKTEVDSFNGIGIALCDRSIMITQEEKEANAKHIAAAPDMLDLLIKIHDDLVSFDIEKLFINEIQSVVKKATE